MNLISHLVAKEILKCNNGVCVLCSIYQALLWILTSWTKSDRGISTTVCAKPL